MGKEQLYTSTQTKLLHNLDRLREMQIGKFRPISIQLSPTNLCSLNCIMCSVANRDKSEELSLEQCIQTLIDFKKLGAQTVENTGGGDCTLYPFINELIGIESSLGYDIGIITNGVRLSNIKYENLQKLKWLRISLNCLDYVEDIHINVPNNITLGFSYVITELSDENKLNKIAAYADKYEAKYVRIVPNCLSIEDITKSTEMIKPYLDKYPRFFFQQKKYNVPKRCWTSLIKPFINTDGWVYACSAAPLIGRKFGEHFRLCNITDISKYWNSDPGAFDTSMCQEGKCFFAEHNNLIEQVITPCEHWNFI
jgi:MoaA/NifB/PqqE/SkfB family radical SAM enzyme